MRGFFVSGTDTNVGKTIITTALVKLYTSLGIKTAPFKPIQTGGTEDIDFILKETNLLLQKEDFFSYSFTTPCSPHLAAKIEDKNISLKKILDDFKKISSKYEMVIVEGAGGLFVPLGDGSFIVDVISALNLPVVLVIDNKVGAINQAMLSIEKLINITHKPSLLVLNETSEGDDFILANNLETIKDISGIDNIVSIPFMSKIDIDKVSRLLGECSGFRL